MNDRVLDEGFDDSRIIGKPLAEVEAMTELDWMGAYPLVETREALRMPDGTWNWFAAPTQVVIGIVDAADPNSLFGGDWEIIDDRYVVTPAGRNL